MAQPKTHRHRAIEHTKRGIGSGVPMPRCRRERTGKACSNGGSRIIGDCKCGAHGAYCPDHGWTWREAQ